MKSIGCVQLWVYMYVCVFAGELTSQVDFEPLKGLHPIRVKLETSGLDGWFMYIIITSSKSSASTSAAAGPGVGNTIVKLV